MICDMNGYHLSLRKRGLLNSRETELRGVGSWGLGGGGAHGDICRGIGGGGVGMGWWCIGV